MWRRRRLRRAVRPRRRSRLGTWVSETLDCRKRTADRKSRCRREERGMFITKKHLSRRTVLRGMGVGIALPLLDAMLPAGVAWANSPAKTPQRLAFVGFPHGPVVRPLSPDQS